MNTNNGRNDGERTPVADPFDKGPNEPTDPTDLDKGDDSAGDTVINAEMRAGIRRGHELDSIALTPLLYVAAIIVVIWIIVYTVVTFTVRATLGSVEEPANPLAAEINSAPLEDRFGRIDASDPEAGVKQPRLEGLSIPIENGPPHARPQIPREAGNSPQYNPEELRPESYGDLNRYQWQDREAGVASIPIGEAMGVILDKKDEYLKSAEKENGQQETEKDGAPDPAPTEANGGQGNGNIDR